MMSNVMVVYYRGQYWAFVSPEASCPTAYFCLPQQIQQNIYKVKQSHVLPYRNHVLQQKPEHAH